MEFRSSDMRPMKVNPPWDVYDPRLGQSREFRLGDGIVGTLPFGLWVLEHAGSYQWNGVAHILDSLVAQYVGDGFVLWNPWSPLARNTTTFEKAFPQARDLSHVLCARGLAKLGLISSTLETMTAMGGRNSGLWALGVATSSSDLVASVEHARSAAESPILATASAMPVIQVALCLDDGVDMLFVRETPGAATAIDHVLRQVRQPPHS
jgi:hypothetical protein